MWGKLTSSTQTIYSWKKSYMKKWPLPWICLHVIIQAFKRQSITFDCQTGKVIRFFSFFFLYLPFNSWKVRAYSNISDNAFLQRSLLSSLSHTLFFPIINPLLRTMSLGGGKDIQFSFVPCDQKITEIVWQWGFQYYYYKFIFVLVVILAHSKI